MNLLSNAYDAINALSSKWIELRAEEAGANVIRVSITDCGHGIRSEVADKIMDPFFTTKDVGCGTGLGLSISRGIVEEHQGRLFYDPTSNHTRFVMDLPKSQASAAITNSKSKFFQRQEECKQAQIEL
jgi:signal transduction histidine kinase